MAAVDYTLEDGIAVVTVNNPPVNALSRDVRAGLLESFTQVNADPSVKGAVVIGADRTFVAGADIREFGKPLEPPAFPPILAAIEASTKPIVAALHGTALGGGLELALACHFRVAIASAQCGLPEVNLGLLPGGGGTQRLPRLVGGEKGLDMIVNGKPVRAAEALALGIVDEVVDGTDQPALLRGAIAFLRKVLAEKRELKLARNRTDRVAGTGKAFFDEVRKKNANKWRGQLAPWHIVDCVEAACTLPFDEGVAVERTKFYELLDSPQSAAMRHIFFAEREAAKVPDVPKDTQPKKIGSVAIIGAGTMGGGIAMAFANAGIAVQQVEVSPEALAKGRGIVEKNYAISVERGSMPRAKADQALARITGATDYAAIAQCDLVIEAVFESMAVKQEVFGKLDAVMKPGAVLATNTSTLDIDQIAAATKRPGDVIGMHFFSPANVMKLLENVRGAQTSPVTIATAMNVARTIGKVPVLAGNCDGFIGNRILHTYGRECDFLLEEGATPWQVDRALQGFGFPMGLYLMRDMAGLDIGWSVRKAREATRDKSERYSPVGDRVCERGRFGQKTGAGYYKYDGRTPSPDPEIETLIADVANELGVKRRVVTDEEIVLRVLSVMANEGAKILDEGIAIRASDIDVTYVFGYGFPRHRGGPMFWAQQYGLDKVLAQVKANHAEHGEPWKPAARLEQAAAKGRW